MMYHHTNRGGHASGFTLVETLVAIAVLMLAIIGPMTIAARGLQSAFFAKEQLTATYLAQEAVEAMRMYRDQYTMVHLGTGSDDWYGGIPASCKSSSGCDITVSSLSTGGIISCDPVANCQLRYRSTAIDPGSTSASWRGMFMHGGTYELSPYTRVIRLSSDTGANGLNEITVDVEVTWQSTLWGGGTRAVHLQSTLFNQYDDY